MNRAKGQGYVSRESKRNGKVTDRSQKTFKLEPIDQGILKVAPELLGRTWYGDGLTIATAPYESERVDVGAEMPCLPTEKSLDLTFDWIQEWVEDRLREAAERVEK